MDMTYFSPGRRSKATRWAVMNGILLCFAHHRMAHDRPDWLKRWLRRNKPSHHAWFVEHLGAPPCRLLDHELVEMKNTLVELHAILRRQT